MDGSTSVPRELLSHVREMLRAVRLFKNELPAQHPAVPFGTVSVLSMIDAMAAGPPAGCHGKELAARCSLDPSTISRTVATLVRSGLVRRTADPADRRASVLSLTPLGRQTLDDVTAWADDRLADALQEWHPDEIATFTALMRRFSTDLTSRYDQPLEAAR
ncbi:MarR family transcriptional regulator [Couchioplanes caeruleus]|uniref:MarR family transcriptional regulator n=1 Tax=Couchioplanes caeruleus TaxID=56438 RepID=UPI00201BD185|nr:MarR family transcriptional regulator [Couchioplanes caeruleus]UQU65153.1 MarR family transcriptional regulator [Couchioplanes caeruleus]